MKLTGLTKGETAFAQELIASGRCSERVRDAKSVHVEFYIQGVSPLKVNKAGKLKISERNEPNFTVAVVDVVRGGAGRPGKPHRQVGMAKRNPHDDALSIKRGKRIALARALAERAKQVNGEVDELESEGN